MHGVRGDLKFKTYFITQIRQFALGSHFLHGGIDVRGDPYILRRDKATEQGNMCLDRDFVIAMQFLNVLREIAQRSSYLSICLIRAHSTGSASASTLIGLRQTLRVLQLYCTTIQYNCTPVRKYNRPCNYTVP